MSTVTTKLPLRVKLTKEMLDDPDNRGKVLAKGMIENSPKGLNMTNTEQGRMLGWVLKAGHGYGDWAVYCHWMDSGYDFILSNGDKVTMRHNVEKIIEFDDECWKTYRL